VAERRPKPEASPASRRHTRVRRSRFVDSGHVPVELRASLQAAAAMRPQFSLAEVACIALRDARTRSQETAAHVLACEAATRAEHDHAAEQAAIAALAAGFLTSPEPGDDTHE
jgi:hypothetical protein